jgi:hypothetical protein
MDGMETTAAESVAADAVDSDATHANPVHQKCTERRLSKVEDMHHSIKHTFYSFSKFQIL